MNWSPEVTGELTRQESRVDADQEKTARISLRAVKYSIFAVG